MRILLLTHAFNRLAQRLFVELRDAGHEVTVELDIADGVTEEAVMEALMLGAFMSMNRSCSISLRCLRSATEDRV